MNDERYWNINLLNKWFAISSIIFMVSMIWMFIDDNDDDFKVYQRKFRQMEIENEEKKLIAELELVKEERVSFEENEIRRDKGRISMVNIKRKKDEL